jgi:hypothetical protein
MLRNTMVIYALDIWDENGRAVIPGWSAQEMFRSSSPLPIPDVGEHIDVLGQKWKVTKRGFSYANQSEEGNYEPAVKVDLYCTKAG